MKHTILGAMLGTALLAAGAVRSAHAGEPAGVEPGLRLAWTFGAQTGARPSLSLGLYPSDRGWRRLWADAGVEELARLEKPAVIDLRFGGDSGPHLMGLPLDAQALGLNAGEGESSGASFLKPVLIVLAAGAAAALVIAAAGDAAKDNNPAVNPDSGDGNGPTVCVNRGWPEPVPDNCVSTGG